MTNYEHLNTISRKTLDKYVNSVILAPEERATLLVANFLREISDTLARIDEKLAGIEMNTWTPGSGS